MQAACQLRQSKHAAGLLGNGTVAAVVIGNGALVLILVFVSSTAAAPALAGSAGPTPTTTPAAAASAARCCAGAAALSALWPALACRLLLLLCTPRLVAAGTEACSEAAVLG